MLRHIVSMKIAAEQAEKRQADIARLSAALAALQASIPEVRDLVVAENVVKRPTNWDLVLVVDFDDADALEVYREHPDHQEALALIEELVSERAVVDFDM